MLKRLPSLSITLTALAVGVFIAYCVHLAGRYNGFNSEELGWKIINYLGWKLWGIPVGASAVGLWYMVQLDRPKTVQGWVSRIGMLTGFFFYLFSWGNTALGAVAGVIAIVSVVILIRQIALDCRAKREARPDYSAQPWLVRFFSHLTTEADEKVRG